LSDFLTRSPGILDKLFKYTGCGEFIKRAIQNPNKETEEAAWDAILPAIDILLEFYEFSVELHDNFPKLIGALLGEDTLQRKASLARQLADIFDFVLKFDDAKMINPAIQNDFSYYRRAYGRMKASEKNYNLKVKEELANRLSLFFAYPTPMMKVLNETTTEYLNTNPASKEAVSNLLATLGNGCHFVVEKKPLDDPLNMLLLRAMTGSIILFDSTDDLGAFAKKSPINIRGCIQILKSYNGGSPTDPLLNALRFTTVHLNDADTPASIKALLV